MSLSNLPDRRWIERVYLPALNGRVLYVGVEFYTAHYPSLATGASSFVFLDASDTAEKHGGPGAIRADFCAHAPALPYDHVSLYGLVGYGTPVARMPELIAHADGMLARGGTLMLGPDKQPTRDAFPEEIWAKLTEEVKKTLPVFSAPPADYWRDLFRQPPLDAYTVLAEDADLPDIKSNYVWWGRKP
ncbi:MAG TPA: hypothetical protein VHE30_13665 [Polyangiaceae bacterium]|nr:hypothetical protein [Polyangiaceae bacterium]